MLKKKKHLCSLTNVLVAASLRRLSTQHSDCLCQPTAEGGEIRSFRRTLCIDLYRMTIPDSLTSFLDNTVFIDTNLGTHLAMAVSDSDTVSDVKEKIEKEHPLCFPHLGNIKVHAIKVARRGFLYHLSDFMYLKSAFLEFDSAWFLSVNASVVDGNGINLLAGTNHCGQIPNYDSPQLQGDVIQQCVNEKAPTGIDFGSCHSSRKHLMIRNAEVAYAVENCSKALSARTRNGCEGLNETLESLPAVKVKHKSKKKKMKFIIGHELVNRTRDDKDHNPLEQVVGFCEQLREHAHNEVSDLPITGTKPNVDESKHGMKRKYNLAEETEVDDKNGKSKKTVHLMDSSSLDVAIQSGSTVKKLCMTESGVMNGVEGNTYLVSDSSKATSTPKVTSEHLSDKKQTSKVVIGSLSTEPDACLLETASSDVKKSKKKKKSKLSGCLNQAVGLISSRVGDEQEASRESDITATVPSPDIEEASIPNLLGTSVRERHVKSAENFASSLVGVTCGNENNIELGDVQSVRDVSDKAVLGVKRMIGSDDLASQRKDPADLQKTISSTDDRNDVQSNHLTCKTGKVVAPPEDRDPVQNTDNKTSMVENCLPSIGDGTDANIKASHISESEHLKGRGTTENAKHGKKKKTKKSRDPVEDRQINLVTTGARDSAHNIPPIDHQSTISGDNSLSKAEIGESTTRVSILPNDRNTDMDKPNISQVELLLQINKTEAVAEDMDGQVRKKIKKRPVTLMKSSPDLQAENVGNEGSLASKRSDKELKSVSTAAKKTEFSKVKPGNEIEEANLDSMLFSEVESNPSFCKKSKAVGSSLTPSHVSEGCEGRSLEENRCSNSTKDGTSDDVDKRIKVSSRTEKVDIVEKADGLQHESVKLHVDKLSGEKIANTTPKAKTKKKNPSACSSAASLSMQSMHKSDGNTETGGHCPTRNSSALKLHGSSSKDKCDGTLHVDNQPKKIPEGGAKSLPSNEHKQRISDSNKATRLREKVVNSSRDSSEKYSETSAKPKLKLKFKKSTNTVLRDKKECQSTGIGKEDASRDSSEKYSETSAKPKLRLKFKKSTNTVLRDKKECQSTGIGKKDVTQSQQRSLLATTAGIFKDASSDSSEDKVGIANSDASTRSPDNSLSSDFSDGESNGNINSSENGFVDIVRTNSGRRSIRKKGPSSPENMSLDTILRSSSRYKKAKLTATQLQEDTESQPVDFVPDSQA